MNILSKTFGLLLFFLAGFYVGGYLWMTKHGPFTLEIPLMYSVISITFNKDDVSFWAFGNILELYAYGAVFIALFVLAVIDKIN